MSLLTAETCIASSDIDVAATLPGVRRSEAAARPDTTPVVFVVDADPSVRESLERLIESAGWQPRSCASAERFLAGPRPRVPSCLVLDIALPGVGGLELQKRVAAERPDMPVIFTTGHGDVQVTVQAMKAGAFEFLIKPLRADVLVDAIAGALERSRAAVDHALRLATLRDRYASLSPREREVMALVVAGLLNKQVGSELGISEITVKAHRGNLMRKMQAASLADLVTMSARLGLAWPGGRPSARRAPAPPSRPALAAAG